MTILYQTPIIAERNTLISVISFVMIFVFAVVSLCMAIEEKINFLVLSLAIFILSIVSAWYFGCEVPTDKSQYEVLLDESYPVEDLYKNYRIIDQRGKIYILEDIDDVRE